MENKQKHFLFLKSQLKKGDILHKDLNSSINNISNSDNIGKEKEKEKIKKISDPKIEEKISQSLIFKKNEKNNIEFNNIPISKNSNNNDIYRNNLVKSIISIKENQKNKVIEKKLNDNFFDNIVEKNEKEKIKVKILTKNILNNHYEKILTRLHPNISTYIPKNYKEIYCVLSRSINGDKLIYLISKCLNLKPVPVFLEPKGDLIFIWGILRGCEILLKNCISKNKNFIYLDHCYFSDYRGHNKSRRCYRMVLNERQLTTIKDVPDDRWKSLNIKRNDDWKRNGSNILIAPPTDAINDFYELNGLWLKKTLESLKNITDRKIIIRYKPNAKTNKLNINDLLSIYRNLEIQNENVPLDEAFKNIRALITFNSNIAVDSIIRGIPVICDKTCVSYPISSSDLKDLETENIYKDMNLVYKWLCSVCYSQFFEDEIISGKAFEILNI